MAPGGLDGDGNNFTGDTTLQPYSAQQTDPYADVPDPPAQSGCTAASSAPNDPTLALTPGCYSSMDLKGNVTMAPGTYYVYGGDIEFGSQANVTGNGVTFVMTGPDGAAGDLKWNGQATVNLTRPDQRHLRDPALLPRPARLEHRDQDQRRRRARSSRARSTSRAPTSSSPAMPG